MNVSLPDATAHNSKQRQFKKVWHPLYTQCYLKLLITAKHTRRRGFF